LWFAVPGETFPKTLGHFNFWPLLATESTAARRGAPWDELYEPGELMDAVVPSLAGGDLVGVRQLNHPLSSGKLGRDTGFLRAIGYDTRVPIAAGAGFASDVLLRTPGGASCTAGGAGACRRNIDWDVQEVMTGASRADWLRYRAVWFAMLSQGFLRAGTANSDSHSLALERVGYPRNLVFGGHNRAALDVARFNADVRSGHMVGTNGPVLVAKIVEKDLDATREFHPGLDAISPRPNATLQVTVSAAPWIPVQEIRVFVNGALARRWSVWDEFRDVDHFGTQFKTVDAPAIEIGQLLGGARDAWIVVEAGHAQDTLSDVDGDGLPDVSDTDGPDENDGTFDLEAIAPGVVPLAFTNPFIVDLDGNGWRAPGLKP
jgi:hypothetical protein